MAILSIIIPVYKVKSYLRECLDSIAASPLDCWEAILIDDGSPDGCPQICDEYAAKDKRFRVIHQENAGVAAARNAGLDIAQGEWLLFMDADDEMTTGALQVFSEAISNYPSCQVFVANETNKSQIRPHSNKSEKYSRFALFHVWLGKLHPRPGALLIMRSIFSEGYDERISFYEDYMFMLTILAKNNIVMIPKITVIYHDNPCGLSKSQHPIQKEMAYYIPELLKKNKTTFWERALLYENIELEIAVWQGNEENIRFYRDMQRKHFAWYHKHFHWLKAQMMKQGLL